MVFRPIAVAVEGHAGSNGGWTRPDARAKVEPLLPEGLRAAALYYLGQLDLLQRDYGAARDHLSEALTLNPEASEVHYPLAQAYRQLGEPALAREHLDKFERREPTADDPLVSELEQEGDYDGLQIAAALARLAQGDAPLLLDPKEEKRRGRQRDSEVRADDRRAAAARGERARPTKTVEKDPLPLKEFPDLEMERFRLDVGYQHGVKPSNIVGAIANEAEIDSQYIGHIEIFDDFSTVDLPVGMPKETLHDLQNAWVCQRKLAIRRLKDDESSTAGRPDGPGRRPPAQAPRRKARKAKPADARRPPGGHPKGAPGKSARPSRSGKAGRRRDRD